jgi:hypothetical protein
MILLFIQFISEVCAAKIAGMAIDPVAEALYTKVGGPVIPEEAKFIRDFEIAPILNDGAVY